MASLQTRINLEIKLVKDTAKKGMFIAHNGNEVWGVGTSREIVIDHASIARGGYDKNKIFAESASDAIVAYTWETGIPKEFVIFHGIAMLLREHDEIVTIVYKNKNRSDEDLKTEFNLED